MTNRTYYGNGNPPLCPKCGNVMVREHIECHDGSGWMHHWCCPDCDPVTPEQQPEPESWNALIHECNECKPTENALTCPECGGEMVQMRVESYDGRGWRLPCWSCPYCNPVTAPLDQATKLTMAAYQQRALETAKRHEGEDNIADTLRWAIGVFGESGEIAERIKKFLRGDYDEHSRQFELDIRDEIGDVLWYLAVLAQSLKLDLETVAQANLDKLASREERDCIRGDGDNR